MRPDWIRSYKGMPDGEIKQLIKDITLTKLQDEENAHIWIKHAIDIFINKAEDEHSEEIEFKLVPTDELKARLKKVSKA